MENLTPSERRYRHFLEEEKVRIAKDNERINQELKKYGALLSGLLGQESVVYYYAKKERLAQLKSSSKPFLFPSFIDNPFTKPSIKFDKSQFKYPFTRIDIIDLDNLLSFLENYTEKFAKEPRNSVLPAVQERINSNFTRDLHGNYFTSEIFQKVKQKLKPTFRNINDIDLFRRNICYLISYYRIIKASKNIESKNLGELVRCWIKWLIFNEDFKFLPVSSYLGKLYKPEFDNSALATVKYLQRIIVSDLDFLPNISEVKRLFVQIDKKYAQLFYSYESIEPNRKIPISKLTHFQKEFIVYVFFYVLSLDNAKLSNDLIYNIQSIMVEEGIEERYYEEIEMDMQIAGLI